MASRAAPDGISQSDVLGTLLRREWMNRFGDKLPPKRQTLTQARQAQ